MFYCGQVVPGKVKNQPTNLPDLILSEETLQVYAVEQDSVELHTHDFLELAYVVDGCVEHTFGEQHSLLQTGDYFIVDYGVAHGYRCAEGETFELINCLFLPQFIDRSLTGCNSMRTLLNNYLIRLSPDQLPAAPTNRIFHDADGTVLRLLSEMITETDEQQQGYMELARCDLIKILLLAMRSICTAPNPLHTGKLSRKIARRIEADPANAPTLSALAAEMHFSVSYLSNRFREETGTTYTAYLQQVRMENACRLLSNSDKPITEVALLCGYQDLKTFYTVFRQHMGVPPGQFRHGLRG